MAMIMIMRTVMGTIITIMISAELGLVRWRRRRLSALPLPVWGEGWGEGVTAYTERARPLTPPFSLWEREQTERAAQELRR
jgi:hypothetical protein